VRTPAFSSTETFAAFNVAFEPPVFFCLWGDGGAHLGEGDESVRRGAESQWIVAARPLRHLQYPVAYLSRLQRILPAVRSKLLFKAARRGSSAAGAFADGTGPWGPRRPLRRVGKRAAGTGAASLAWILT
jgi:hypothetical protein